MFPGHGLATPLGEHRRGAETRLPMCTWTAREALRRVHVVDLTTRQCSQDRSPRGRKGVPKGAGARALLLYADAGWTALRSAGAGRRRSFRGRYRWNKSNLVISKSPQGTLQASRKSVRAKCCAVLLRNLPAQLAQPSFGILTTRVAR